MPLTVERLKEVLLYDADTGVFIWRVSYSRAREGAVAGTTDAYGYIVIRIDRILYKAHRLAWLYTYGEWPAKGLDHINRVKSDNRIENLRCVSQSVNMHNASRASKSGVPGVVWNTSRKAWDARIRIAYRSVFLGRYQDKQEAIAARRLAEQRVWQTITR